MGDARTRRVVAVVGPTGSGKSDLALAIAARFHGEVVSCDSVQVYRHFDVGTAKLKEFQRKGIPHHLIDILEPGEPFTAGDYAQRAGEVVEQILDRARLPVIAGGTGFYLRALQEGLFPGPPANHDLRARLEAMESRKQGRLHRLLRRWDSPAAMRIHRNDTHKLIRALEVFLITGRTLSESFLDGRVGTRGFSWLKIGLDPPRRQLRERIARRTEAMYRAGLVEEVRGILARGCPPSVKPFESVGYKQALAVVRGEMSEEEGMEKTQIATRQYAKRQMTWFRREQGVEWFSGFGDDPEVAAAVLSWLEQVAGWRAGNRRTVPEAGSRTDGC